MAEEANDLEQGFNEEELEDIMNEIESLEAEFSEDDPGNAPKDSKSDKSDEDNVVELRSNAKEEPAQESKAPEKTVEAKAPVQEPVKKEVAPAAKVSAPTTSGNMTEMDFSVAGSLNLKLNFKVGENCVSLVVQEGEGMVIELESGAKFTIPFDVNNKKSA